LTLEQTRYAIRRRVASERHCTVLLAKVGEDLQGDRGGGGGGLQTDSNHRTKASIARGRRKPSYKEKTAPWSSD